MSFLIDELRFNGLVCVQHSGRPFPGSIPNSKRFKVNLEVGTHDARDGHVNYCLGPAGLGQATKWALTEHPLNGAPATKEFMAWKKQKPRRKIQLSLAG